MRWLWLSVVLVGADQVTKALASTYLAFHQPLAVLPVLNLTLTHNTGAAFSFLSDAGGWQRWFFTAVAVAVSAVLLFWLRGLPPGHRRVGAGIALVLGGAVGNLIDRVVLGHVVDFIDLHYAGWHWPAFNVADSGISVGVALLLWDTFRGPGSAPADRDAPPHPPGR
jgi:signal peptidase II